MKPLMLVALSLCCGALGQQSTVRVSVDSMLINTAKPSVFVTFLRAEESKSDISGRLERRVWLQITNNTRWAIWSLALPDAYGGSGWFYRVEKEDTGSTAALDRSLPFGYAGDVAGPLSIEPGRAALVSVPPDHLKKGFAIRFKFYFIGEPEGSPVTHSVTFASSDMPPQ